MATPRILLVDDERDISRMLRSSLELSGQGFIVVDVPSGEEALLELARGPVDVLVTDLRLPGISGLELLGKVRQLNPNARAIMITGQPIDDVRAKAEELGVLTIMPKPIGTSAFLEAVNRALQLQAETGSPVKVIERLSQPLKERLESLRNELGAEATFLFDQEGQAVAQAGGLVDVDLKAALPALMMAFGAGLKVSNLLGCLLPGNFQYFDGERYDFYLTNVGAYYALLIAFHGKQEPGQMGSVVHFGGRAADDLLSELSQIGAASLPETAAEEQEKPGRAVPELLDDELFSAAETVDRVEAERFWEDVASTSSGANPAEGDVMTYEEARKRGLLSDDEGG